MHACCNGLASDTQYLQDQPFSTFHCPAFLPPAAPQDTDTGSLWESAQRADMLFRSQACMASVHAACASTGSEFHAVSHHGLDPMLRRLVMEARTLAKDDVRDAGPASARWRYIWNVAQEDLHNALEGLVVTYR